MSTHISTHGVDPDSIEVSIRRFENFISLDINFRSRVSGTSVTVEGENALIVSEHYGYDLHDALVTLKAVFPNHTFEDCREGRK